MGSITYITRTASRVKLGKKIFIEIRRKIMMRSSFSNSDKGDHACKKNIAYKPE
ncbi:hypothetical protein Rahaq_1474 [Rahnella aceris]|uniref:Uncharacterized protein n=1 Tax=Rahnella sp. (strain Y9602) TaxID=2703885 RepID=A0A0H3F7A1_RAHSY|nr:hypothetical protein Rahaq_1474 [Rahnella aceris]